MTDIIKSIQDGIESDQLGSKVLQLENSIAALAEACEGTILLAADAIRLAERYGAPADKIKALRERGLRLGLIR